MLRADNEERLRKEAAAAAQADAEATQGAETTRTAARILAQSEEGEDYRPEYEIRDFESIVTDQGIRAEILLDIYADGSPAGDRYSVLHALYEESQWWVDCDRR